MRKHIPVFQKMMTKNEIKNITKNETYSMKPFPDLIGKIIEAGGLFRYKP